MKFFKVFLLGIFLFCVFAKPIFAQQALPQDTYMKAEVVQSGKSDVQAKIFEGVDKGKSVHVTYDQQNSPDTKLHTGDTIVIAKTANLEGANKYYFVDQYRLPIVICIVFAFLIFIAFITGKRSIGGIAGLLISLAIIFVYIVPQILAGNDPLFICLTGAIGILLLTIYIAHGVSRQTTIALVSTLLALLCTFFLAQFITHISSLTGLGDQEAADLHFGLKTAINLKGIFLGGIILATLGALNDITITQAAAIFSLHKTNKDLKFLELAKHGFSIGKEHALSLINTLVLAYAGTSLSLFLFFFYNPNNQPLWVALNSEWLSEEIIKTIAGTSGLLLSMPLATLLAALACDKAVREYTKDFFHAVLH